MTQSSLPPVDAATLAQMPACNAIDLILPDMNGLLRGKRITRDALEKIYADGVCLPMSLIATDITGNTVEETGLGYDIGAEDRICRPVPGSLRSEERRVGNECGSTCRSRRSQYNYKKTHTHIV